MEAHDDCLKPSNIDEYCRFRLAIGLKVVFVQTHRSQLQIGLAGFLLKVIPGPHSFLIFKCVHA
jgi:hypothetical protein